MQKNRSKSAALEARRESLRSILREGPTTAGILTQRLGISQPVFSRLVQEIKPEILVVGKARRAHYALRRAVPEVGHEVPLFCVNQLGKVIRLGILQAVYPSGFYFHQDDLTTFFEEIPYFLEDIRPSGFLGRLVPRQHPEHLFSPDVRLWSGNETLRYLTQFAWNAVGNLLVGDGTLHLFLTEGPSKLTKVKSQRRLQAYNRMAQEALELGDAGSSAGGEQPKFICQGQRQVIVKFSPSLESKLGRRRADLLICEHLSHEVLRKRGIRSAQSEILIDKDRVYLEVQRFDRTPQGGRIGQLSCRALDYEFVGSGKTWSDTAKQLHHLGMITAEIQKEVEWLDFFGALIGNTDRHLANLAFEISWETGFTIERVAPVYDMLPMFYAPANESVLDKSPPVLPLPKSEEYDLWQSSCAVALEFWQAVIGDKRLSPAFRSIARDHMDQLMNLRKISLKIPR